MITQQGQEILASECAEIQEIIPVDELEQYAKISDIVDQLNICEAERLKQDGFTNECFFNSDGTLTKEYKITFKEKKKYFYIDFGTSGVFMVEKSTGNIFNIKGYGTINKAKFRGNINSVDIKELHSKRWNYR